LPDKLSLEGFLARIRRAKRAGRRAEMDQARQVAINADLPADQQYMVVHADCRQYRWPAEIDVIATDPPWHDLDAYRWLGNFAKGHLRDGGQLLAQCGQFRLPDVLDVLRQAGLTWQWMLDIVYPMGPSQVKPIWLCNWRPVVVFTKGDLDPKSVLPLSDTYTVGRQRKLLHPWQQPLEAWDYWMKSLAAPGSLTADPYCGSGTIGVALKKNGEGRRYLGTDSDLDHVKVARHRLMQEVE
jgi:hypothetical protein